MHADVINPLLLQPSAATSDTRRHIARLAIRSLHTELRLHPKPGLVTPLDNGSHHDMTADTFLRSLFALRHYFRHIAQAGSESAPFEMLRALGIAAERTMMRATGGINTHRGAIFAVGMLSAAIGAANTFSRNRPLHADDIRTILMLLWGPALHRHALKSSQARASELFIDGARTEAASGFPSVFNIGLPTLRRSLALRRNWQHACIDTLFALIAHIDDTNMVHRGGRVGADEARGLAQQFIDAGATGNATWERTAQAIGQRFVALNLSPGGAADLLAATCLVYWASSADRLLQ